MKETLVTVVLNFFNEERFIKQAIDSLLEQSYGNMEILLIDDCSTDKSASIAREYELKHDRIRLIRNQENRGLACGRNIGMKEARGEYIAFHDGDDYSMKDRIRIEVEYLDSHESVVAVSGCMQFIDEEGKELNESFFECIDDDMLRARMLFGNVFPNPASMIRRKLYTEYSLMQNEEYKCAQDYDYWLRCFKYGHLHLIPEILVAYRIHESQSRKYETDNKRVYDDWMRTIIKNGWETAGINLNDQMLNYVFNVFRLDIKVWKPRDYKNYRMLNEKIDESCNDIKMKRQIKQVHKKGFDDRLLYYEPCRIMKLLLSKIVQRK